LLSCLVLWVCRVLTVFGINSVKYWVIWDNKKQNLINKLENIQLDAAIIVTGGTRLTSHDSLYEETKWEKLKDRRNKVSVSSLRGDLDHACVMGGDMVCFSYWK
jgi:shikimate kinase